MKNDSRTSARPVKCKIAVLLCALLCLAALLPLVSFAAPEGESDAKPYELMLLLTDAAAGKDCDAELVLRTPQRNDFGYGAVRYRIEITEAPADAEIRLAYLDDNGERDWIADRLFPMNAPLSIQAEANQHYAFTASFSQSGRYSFVITLLNIIENTVIQTEHISFEINEEIREADAIVLPQSISLTVGSSDLLSFTVLPNGSAIPAVGWVTADPSIVTVTPEGVLTAIAPGTTVVTVTADSGISASCTVTVTEEEPETLPPETEPTTKPIETEPPETVPDTAPDTAPVTEASETAPQTAPVTEAPETDAPPTHDAVGDFARALLYGAIVLLGVAVGAIILLMILRARARKKSKKTMKKRKNS